MKILDRYIIVTFLKNYVISFMVLVGLYVVLDMIINFDELVDVKGSAGGWQSVWRAMRMIGDFYGHQMFLIFVQLSGIIPIVAAAFTLMRLARFNELTAVLAAGVPLLRVAMPIIIVSMFLNGLLIADQELVIPSIVQQLTREHSSLYAASSGYSVQAMPVGNRTRLYAGKYIPASGSTPPRMQVIDLIEFNERMEPASHVLADEAVWDVAGEQWMLINGRRRDINVTGTAAREQRLTTYQSTATPEEIALYRSGDFVQLLSTHRINQLAERPESFGKIELLRVKHSRFTQPLVNMVLLLLAIAAVLSREMANLKTAATKCVAITGMGMGLVFLSYHLAGFPPDPAWIDRWPALMAWLPVILLGPLAVWLLDRVKT